MVKQDTQSSFDYRLDDVKYMPDGDESSKDNISLANIIFQVDIFENIERPFLSGQIILSDNTGIYDKFLDIKGTERLLLQFSNPETTNVIEKRFVIRKVHSSTKTAERSESIILNIVDETYYIDTVLQFSKAFKGTPDVIIKNILKDQLNVELISPLIGPYQGSMKVVVPYMTPLKAAKWITNRASTEHGFPYYLYATLFDSKLTLKSLEEMFTQDYWNTEYDFQYSQARNERETNLVHPRNLYNINDFKQNNTEDTLLLMERGSIGSSYNVIDLTTGVSDTFRFNSDQLFKDVIFGNKLLGKDTDKMLGLLDDTSVFGDDNFKLSDRNGQNYDRVVMVNTYNDIGNYYTGTFRLDATSKAIKNIIVKSSAKISVGGYIFFSGSENRTIGSKINIDFPNNRSDIEYQNKDLKRSGEYVIHSCRHSFIQERHIIDATIVKLGNLKE